MKKESSTNLQKYSGIAEQMIKMSSDCPEITNWKNKYEKCLEELKKESTRWWRF